MTGRKARGVAEGNALSAFRFYRLGQIYHPVKEKPLSLPEDKASRRMPKLAKTDDFLSVYLNLGTVRGAGRNASLRQAEGSTDNVGIFH